MDKKQLIEQIDSAFMEWKRSCFINDTRKPYNSGYLNGLIDGLYWSDKISKEEFDQYRIRIEDISYNL